MNLSSFPAHKLPAKILLFPLVYLVLQIICQNISVDTSRFTNWWSDSTPHPLAFKMRYVNFIQPLWLQKDSKSHNTFLFTDWKRLISKMKSHMQNITAANLKREEKVEKKAKHLMLT